MISILLSRMITRTAGTLYPAYRSYKAVRTKDVREYVKWMMYWIVFALYCFIEDLADVFVAFWFPFYYEVKILFVIWLLSPWTKGASILYRKWVHPTLSKHEKEIDLLLEQAKTESYNQVMRIGSRTLLCARDIVAEAAIRGQQQLVNQIQKSYSMSDVSTVGGDGQVQRKMVLREEEVLEIKEVEEQDGSDEDFQPEIEEIEPPRRRRQGSRSRSRPLEGGENAYATMPRRNPRRH